MGRSKVSNIAEPAESREMILEMAMSQVSILVLCTRRYAKRGR